VQEKEDAEIAEMHLQLNLKVFAQSIKY